MNLDKRHRSENKSQLPVQQRSRFLVWWWENRIKRKECVGLPFPDRFNMTMCVQVWRNIHKKLGDCNHGWLDNSAELSLGVPLRILIITDTLTNHFLWSICFWLLGRSKARQTLLKFSHVFPVLVDIVKCHVLSNCDQHHRHFGILAKNDWCKLADWSTDCCNPVVFEIPLYYK